MAAIVMTSCRVFPHTRNTLQHGDWQTTYNSLKTPKDFTFSVDGTKTAILIIGKKKNKEYEIDAHVKKGKIPITDNYKYLGKWYNEQGNNKLAIAKKNSR